MKIRKIVSFLHSYFIENKPYILIQRSKKSSKEIVQGDPLQSSFLEAERPPANEIPAARLSLVGTCSEVHGHLEKHHEGVLRNGGVALACAQTSSSSSRRRRRRREEIPAREEKQP